MKHPSPLAVLFVAATTAAPATSQFVNRATWLGVEEESIRTDFKRGAEYFLDRQGYVVLPPWWNRGLAWFDNKIQYTGGSTSTSELSLEGSVDYRHALGSGFTFGYHMLQSENRDTRFLRTAIEMEYELDDESAAFVQAELFAEKSVVDLSVGAWLFRREAQALRIMLTSVDAPSRKGERIEYTRDPYALQLAGAFGKPDGHRVAFDIGGQLPLEFRDDVDEDDVVDREFEIHRWIVRAQTHLRLNERDWIVGAADIEWTEKEQRGFGGGFQNEDFRRDFRDLRIEWWRDGDVPWSVGVSHIHLVEDGIAPGPLINSLRGRRSEWMAIGRVQVPLSEQFSFEPTVLAGTVRRTVQDSNEDFHVDDFEGKIAMNGRYDFSPSASIVFQIGVQLDEPGFGGGGIQFVSRF